MSGRLDGQVTLVTGAASGIGKGIARRFVAEGARCVVVDIQDEPGLEFARELGPEAAVYTHADVAVENDVAAAVDLAVGRFGRLDCIVNNAGILGAVGPIGSITAQAWQRTLDVLLNSVFFGIKHAARAMTPQRSGSIVNIASTAGVRAGLGPHAYTAAKHAVVGLTQSAATELGRSGIRVNAIAPGATVSCMTAYVATGDASALDRAERLIARTVPLGRPGTPEDIANAALFLSSAEASWVNGAVLVVDAGGEVIGDRNGRFVEMDTQLVSEAGQTT